MADEVKRLREQVAMLREVIRNVVEVDGFVGSALMRKRIDEMRAALVETGPTQSLLPNLEANCER